MIGPEQTAARFAGACLLGALLGILYGFLRPLRPKHTAAADLLFVCCAFWAWVYLGFAICRGDLRIGYTAGLFVGCLLWEWTVGRLLRPVFSGFWFVVRKIFHFLLLPLQKFFKKIAAFAKFLLASWKKWVTIKWNNRPLGRKSGGTIHGTEKKSLQRSKTGLPSKPHPDQSCGAGCHRIVYGSTADAAQRHSDR
jgi:hypothetical protein